MTLKPVFLLTVGLFFLGVFNSNGEALKITKIPSNGGSVETANISCHDGAMYVQGWLKPHYWSENKIFVRVDVKDAQGKVIATKTDYSYPTGRPQTIAQFGVLYLVSFDASLVKGVAAVDVTYIN